MKPIRLIQVVPDLDIGGLQRVVVSLCRNINREKYDISVLCLNRLGSFADEIEMVGIRVLLLPQIARRTDYLAFLKVAKVFKENKVQIVHTHNTQPFLDSVMASWFSRVEHIIHTDHARNFPDKKRYMVAEWIASHFVDKIVGVSEHTSHNLNRYEKIPLKKILTIPNGVDESVYDFTIDKNALKKEFGLSGTGPVIGLGVRLSEQKGITYLLNAMPGILKSHPDVTLLVAGDGPLSETLHAEAKQLGIEHRVCFVGPRTDMPRILKLLDLYVLPSIWEGLPMVILESLAAGCPIVATDVGGNSTAIRHRYNGSLLPSKDSTVLEREIIFLLDHPEIMGQYIQNGRDVFRKNFSAATMAKRLSLIHI